MGSTPITVNIECIREISLWPHRLIGKDNGFSSRGPRFDSEWGYQFCNSMIFTAE